MGNEEEEDVWGWLNKPIAAPADSGAIPQGRPDMPVITPKQQGFISSTVAPLAAAKGMDAASNATGISNSLSAIGSGITGGMSAANVGNSILANAQGGDALGNLLASNSAYGTAAPLAAPAAEMGATLAATAPVAETAVLGGMAAPAAVAGAEAAGAGMMASIAPFLGPLGIGLLAAKALKIF